MSRIAKRSFLSAFNSVVIIYNKWLPRDSKGKTNLYTEPPQGAVRIGFKLLKGGLKETTLLTRLPNPNEVKYAKEEQVTMASLTRV